MANWNTERWLSHQNECQAKAAELRRQHSAKLAEIAKAEEVLKATKIRHEKTTNEILELERIAQTDAPSGYTRCCGEDETGRQCPEIIPNTKKALQEAGWEEGYYSCGCGETDEWFCPKHAEQHRYGIGCWKCIE